MNKTWKVVGIDFDHMHMGDNLWMVHHHPNAEIVGIYDTRQDRLDNAAAELSLARKKSLLISARAWRRPNRTS